MSRLLHRIGLLVLFSALFIGLPATPASAQTCTGVIGDMVWFDANQNGLRDAGEAANGINGVVLELRDSAGALVATQTTGAGVGSIPGLYAFGQLCAGTYTLTIVSGVPAGYVPTVSPPGADPTRDSSTSPVTVTLAIGQKRPDVDFGFIAGCTGSIGDRVWNDADGDGIQDPGEAGLPGVQVRLYQSGSQIASTTTDANGNYSFPGLCPGDYRVFVDTPAAFVSSPLGGTADTSLDSDASGVVVPLGFNENNPTIDFGFFAACTGVVGDRVWFDANRNGIQDAGELGLANVTVELLNSGGTVIATTISNSAGGYQFTGLCAGTYFVRVVSGTLPAGVVPTLTSPPGGGTAANDSNASPASVTLAGNASSDLTIDFGFNAPCAGSIGDFVWNDLNSNGIQDAGEPGIANVSVTLRDADTNAVLGVATTGANGAYLFEGLCLGDYIVEVDPTTLPAGMVASPANQGGNDTLDSDGVDHEALVTLPADDTTDLTIDFGYFRKTRIQIVKLTNDTDNNSPTGPQIEVGGSVTWTYHVTAAGSTEPLRDVLVVDDNGTPADPADDFVPVFSGGDANGNGLLDPGETWIYVAHGAATAGQYVNWGTATGTGNSSGVAAPPSRDPDHYFGFEPPPDPAKGRFTGGGFVMNSGRTRITFGLTIHCDLLL